MTYGNVVAAEIEPAGDVDAYTFEGKAGDIAFIVGTETGDDRYLQLEVELFDPGGKSIAKGSALYGVTVARLTAPLTVDGRYSLRVWDSSERSGPYVLLLKNGASEAGMILGYDDLVTSEIKPVGDVDVYVFEGKAGDIALIVGTETGDDRFFQLEVELFDPDGKSIAKGSALYGVTVARLTVPLTLDGRHSVRVWDSRERAGAYTLYLKNLVSR